MSRRIDEHMRRAMDRLARLAKRMGGTLTADGRWFDLPEDQPAVGYWWCDRCGAAGQLTHPPGESSDLTKLRIEEAHAAAAPFCKYHLAGVSVHQPTP